MITEARVISTEGDIAVVENSRKSACEGCHKNAEGGCGVCTLIGPERKIAARAYNRLGAAVGDTVSISTRTGRVLGYALLVFLVPIFVAALGWWCGGFLVGDTTIAAVFAAAGVVLSFVFLWLYSKLVVSKRCDAEIVEIIRRADEN